ncbi:CBS domain-containing protein [Pseudonocardia sp.]|uniref:CBS domain-containing protein n=1 Tax=Pseudonocardia sp. TaxID=60912 RepID=UPI003D0DAB87
MTRTPPAGTDTDPEVGTLMSRQLVAIVPEATTIVALRLMITTGVRHLPVVADSRVLGVLTETDLLHALGDPGGDGRTVATLARAAVVVRSADRRGEAARRMYEAGADAVVVADPADPDDPEVGGGRLVGIVTATDVLRSLAGGHR